MTFLPTKNGKHSVTSVVGPNGSGKSNVADAIRWVMGEQSMKQIRGKKSEDVIFSGSDSKGQMGMASVSLVLDNADGRVDIESEEVVIARRLYRSGESEYLVNGHAVRLLDLQLLLAKAQFAHGSYSVIGQGMIDKLLLQSSAERKDFFDEATGIKEFQIKRHQASLKLARTREHVDQAQLLLNEVSPRLRTLSRQVKKLEERKDVEQTLREQQESYYATLFSHNQSQIDVLDKELAAITSRYTKLQEELMAVQTELATLAKESSMQELFAQLQTKFQDASRQKNTLERERAVLQGKLQVEYAKAGQQNVGWLTGKIEELKQEQVRVDRELSQAEDALGKVSAEITEQKIEIEKQSIRRTELRGQIAELQHRMLQVKSEQAVMQLTGMRAVQAVLEARHEFGDVHGAVAQLGEVEERYQLALDVAAGGNLSSIVVGSDRTASACIDYLRREQLGVATFLPLNKIKPRFATQDMHDLLGRAGVHGFAIDLVRFDKKFSDVFSYVLGNTLVVENLAAAREIGIGRIRMVTLDGDMLETSGSMKGGFRKRNREGLSFGRGAGKVFAGQTEDQEKKLLALQQELADAERGYETAQETMREYQSQAHIAGSSAQSLGEKKQGIDRDLASFTQELNLTTMNPKEYDAVMKTVAHEADELKKHIDAQEKIVQGIQKEIERFHAEEEKKKQRVFALQDAMQSLQQELNGIVSEKNQKEISIAKLETKQEDLGNEVYQELHVAPESLVTRNVPTVTPDALEGVLASIQKLKYTLSLIGGIDEEVVKEFAETKERHDALVTQLDDLEKAMGDLEKMIVELDELMRKKRDKVFRQIKKEFSRYFEILFEGGKADLVEVYGEETVSEESGILNMESGDSEVAEAIEDEELKPKKKAKEVLVGIDVVANPPGKKIKNIQALSGGERTMTSIALVCAILRTNPSPFVVLDEVEAALDEANTLRFTKILGELAEQSQFIIITHNRATMHTADALYGVTMGNDGVSKLLSVRLETGN